MLSFGTPALISIKNSGRLDGGGRLMKKCASFRKSY